MNGTSAWIVAALILSAVVWVWTIYQRRQLVSYKNISDRIRKEKESVFALMDNVGERMTRNIDLDQTLEVIAQYVVEATSAESGAVFLLDEELNILQARVVVGLFPPLFEDEEIGASRHKYQAEKIRRHKIPLGEGIIGKVALDQKPLLIADAEADPRVPPSASQFFPLHSLLLCPLVTRGRTLGVLVMANKESSAVFDDADQFLMQALADQASITVDLVKLHAVAATQLRLNQELKIAHEFQTMLMPRECPSVPGFEFSALNDSALNVGGDFYDFFWIDDDHLGIAIGDVSGKGIPAALIMATVRAVLRAEARDIFSPKEALRRVNTSILTDTKESVFVTITYGILDFSTQRFRFARAGHEPTLVSSADGEGDVRVLLPEGMALGLMPSRMFDHIEEVELQLRPGDSMLLYTDGAIEAIDASDQEYGRERLIRLFSDNRGKQADELIKLLAEDIREHARGIAQHDDITLLSFRAVPEQAADASRKDEGRETA